MIADPDGCSSLIARDAAHESWKDRLPEDSAGLWAWCLGQTQDTLLQLLAVAASRTIDAVQEKGERPDSDALRHAGQLGAALSLQAADWFTPTAANFFGRVSRATTIDALAEAKGVSPAPGWFKLKKADLAALAEREIANTGWLPQPLRPRVEPDAAANDDTPDEQAA